MSTSAKVLVIGGSGFLGSHVADALSAAGYAVTIFDRQTSRYLTEDQAMILGDILDLEQVRVAVSGHDYVYNFAGISDIGEAARVPLDTAKLNVLGNINILEACKDAKVKRVIFASTVYVYSNGGSFYRISKQSSEQFIEGYHEAYGLDYTILRYGSLYGRRADRRNTIWRMVREALWENKITYDGSIKSMREYIHVRDAAQMSVRILAPEHANRHLIISGSERMAVRDVMGMIAELLPHNVELVFAGDSNSTHYSMTPYRFNPKVGYKIVPTDFVDLGQGLLDCLQEVQEALRLPDDGLMDHDS